MGDFIRKSDLICLRIKQLNNNLKVSSIKLLHNGQKNHQNMYESQAHLSCAFGEENYIKKTKNLNRFQQCFFLRILGSFLKVCFGKIKVLFLMIYIFLL
jgi:hypothetical protein